MAALAAMTAMTACTSENDFTEPVSDVKTYQVNIHASFGGTTRANNPTPAPPLEWEGSTGTTRAVTFDGTASSSTFRDGERVYVYNATSGKVMLNDGGTAAGYLTPTNISADGKSCDLTGTLTGTITATDQLLLMYNLNEVYPGNDNNRIKTYSDFKYNGQNGTATGVTDGATATMTGWSIDGGVLTTTSTAQFQNVQSMFRFSFKDNDTGDDLSVKQVQITSQNNALVRYYYPMKDEASRYSKYGVGMYNGEAVSGFIYMALCIDEAASAADVLTFEVKDGGGNKYEGTKAAPAAGFRNGKYYYSSAPIALTLKERRIMPTITWTTPSTAPETIGDEMIVIEDDDADFALSGTSEGVCFLLVQNGTVRLNGLNASYGGDNFIAGNYNMTLDISGANTIACKNYNYSILVQDNLKLQGYGTLTVTANDATECGIRGNANYAPGNSWQAETNANATTDEIDVSAQLAATGYKVVRSARTDNADGTYTWTYTVSPSLAMPLTMQALTAGTIVVNRPKEGMQYRLNGGDKTPMTETTTIEVAKGDKVQFFGSGTTITSYYGTYIAGGSATVKVYGNIMSLVDEEGYASATTLTSNLSFACLFMLSETTPNDKLTDASGLLLPATGLTTQCYAGMFGYCTNLTAAPALPAETLAEKCYQSMFQGCTSLTAAPALPATTLASNCYRQMFQGCTSLTSVPAKLPAKTLKDYCYKQMFQGCTSLTTSPELPATKLKDYCYQEMFKDCSSLSAVTCLATNKSATLCTNNWLSGVAATGTFTRAMGVTWSTGTDGIPSGWTVVDAQ